MAVFEPNLPVIIKFLVHALSIPVSEVVCESKGVCYRYFYAKMSTANDGKTAEAGTTNMRIFIVLHGSPQE